MIDFSFKENCLIKLHKEVYGVDFFIKVAPRFFNELYFRPKKPTSPPNSQPIKENNFIKPA